MTQNGQATAEQTARLTESGPPPGTPLQLDPSQLSVSDLRRAKAGPLGGRDPFEVLNDPLDAATLTIWCLMSRHDDSFTWQQADELPLGRFGFGEAEPAEVAAETDPEGEPEPASSSASEPGNDSGKTTSRKRRSATSTG